MLCFCDWVFFHFLFVCFFTFWWFSFCNQKFNLLIWGLLFLYGFLPNLVIASDNLVEAICQRNLFCHNFLPKLTSWNLFIHGHLLNNSTVTNLSTKRFKHISCIICIVNGRSTSKYISLVIYFCLSFSLTFTLIPSRDNVMLLGLVPLMEFESPSNKIIFGYQSSRV